MIHTYKSRMSQINKYAPVGNKLALIELMDFAFSSEGPEVSPTTQKTVRFATPQAAEKWLRKQFPHFTTIAMMRDTITFAGPSGVRGEYYTCPVWSYVAQ